MKNVALPVLTAALLAFLFSTYPGSLDSSHAAAPKKAAAKQIDNVQTGNPGFKRIGRLGFGPDGLLLVADPASAAIVAIDTGDNGPVQKLKKKVSNVDELIGGAMGAEADGVEIVDMAVNPKSGLIYL